MTNELLKKRNLDSIKCSNEIDFRNIIVPETKLEEKLLNLLEVQKGFNFWVKGKGHPEGKVGLHVKEVIDNIDLFGIRIKNRERLRIAAIIHDVFKNLEHQTYLAGNKINHGTLASSFFKAYVKDELILKIVKYHDEPYYAWRHEITYNSIEKAKNIIQELEAVFQNDLQLLYLFFLCDTMTGNKTLAPIDWFKQRI